GIEVGNAADDCARWVVEHRFVAEIDRGLRRQLELNGADRDFVAGGDLRLSDEVAIHLDAVCRLEVNDPPGIAPALKTGMLSGDRGVIQYEVVPLATPNRHLSLEVGHALYAEVDVMDLQCLHV